MRTLVSGIGLVVLLITAAMPGAHAQTSSKIAFESNMNRTLKDVWLINEDGSNPTNLTAIAHDPNDLYDDVQPKLCRNKVVFVSNKDGNNDIWVINVNGTGPINLTPGVGENEGLLGDREPDCIRPDPVVLGGTGRVVFLSEMDHYAGEIYTVSLDGGLITRLTNNVAIEDDPSWCGTSGNKIVFTRVVPIAHCIQDPPINILVMDQNGANEISLACSEHKHTEPACSPDGLVVAYSHVANCGTPPGLARIEKRSTTCACGVVQCPSQFLTTAGNNTDSSWSPGGAHIAFASDRPVPGGGDYEIYKMSAEEGDVDELNFFQLTTNTISDVAPDWAETKP